MVLHIRPCFSQCRDELLVSGELAIESMAVLREFRLTILINRANIFAPNPSSVRGRKALMI